MPRHTVLALALPALIGCGDRQEAGPRIAGPPTLPPKIQADVPYKVISDSDEGPVRRVVDVELNRKVPPEVLREIALKVKAKEDRPHQRTAIFYYLPEEFPENAGHPWASTHFRPALEVEILGLSGQEEDRMRSMRLDHQGERVGAWLQDNQYKMIVLIYDEGGAIKIAEIRSPTERSESKMVELPYENGRRFKKVNGSNVYDIDLYGNLRISNAEGQVISAARPMK